MGYSRAYMSVCMSVYLSVYMYGCLRRILAIIKAYPVIARSACRRRPRFQSPGVSVYYVGSSFCLVVRGPFAIFICINL